MESFNAQALRAKHAAGFKGGPFFTNIIPTPKMKFVEGVPSEVTATGMHKGIPSGKVIDPWYSRK